MEFADLKIGTMLNGVHRCYDFKAWMRVEFVAADWAVARDDDGGVHLLSADSQLEAYVEGEE